MAHWQLCLALYCAFYSIQAITFVYVSANDASVMFLCRNW